MKNKLLLVGLITILTVVMSVGAFASTKGATSKETQSKTVERMNEKGHETENEVDEAVLATDNMLSTIEATDIAMASVDQAAQFIQATLEDENGTIVYGVEVTLNEKTLDIKVDATTGQVLASDEDDDHEYSVDEEDDNDNDNDQVEHENDNEDPEGYED
jgi:uncharacterized membrane protein YkoI